MNTIKVKQPSISFSTVWAKLESTLRTTSQNKVQVHITGTTIREYKVSVFWYQFYKTRLRQWLVESRGLTSDSTCVLEAEPGKLDIKRREPGILFISLQVSSFFKLAIMMLLSSFVSSQRHWQLHSKSVTSSWPDKDTCHEIANVYQVSL